MMLKSGFRNEGKYLTYFLFILCGFLFACQESTGTVENEAEPVISCDTSRISVLPYEEWLFGNEKNVPSNLTLKEICKIQELLPLCFDSYNEELKNSLLDMEGFEDYKINDLSSYVQQIVPYKNEKGEKMVWINFLCGYSDKGNNEWRKSIIEVLDGGNCYLSLRVNLETEQCSQIYVNGYA